MPIDAVDVRGEVVGLGIVEAVALVGKGAVRDVHEGVDGEAGNNGAVRMQADLLLGDDLFCGDQHGRRRARDVRVHVRVAVDLAIAEAVGAVHVEQRHVGEERGHGEELLAGIRAVDDLGAAHVHQARAHHGQRGQEGHAHGRRAEAQAEREMAPLLHGHAPGLHVLAVDLRQPPRQADSHPRRDDLVHGARDHAPLALVAHEVARDAEPGGPAPQERAHERERRAREETAAEGDVVAVPDARHRVVDRRQLLAGGLGLRLEALPRGLEVVLAAGDRHPMISQVF